MRPDLCQSAVLLSLASQLVGQSHGQPVLLGYDGKESTKVAPALSQETMGSDLSLPLEGA